MGKQKRIALVGGGLASLHLAYLLRSSNVECTIYEADDRLGGKIQSIQGPDGYIHELGACYVSPSYKNVYNLFKKLGCDIEKHFLHVGDRECVYQGKPERFERWIYLEALPFLPRIFKYLPKFIANPLFFLILLRKIHQYLRLHKKLLGSYSEFMPPCPSTEVREKLSVPFLEFLQTHQLQILIPLFKIFQTAQGYGFLEAVPTYYGLVWCSPSTMQVVISQILGKRIFGGAQSNAFLLSVGFETLIRLLAEQSKAKIRLSSKVTKIERDSDGVTIHSNGEQEQYDFVVIGSPPSTLEGILDFNPQETALFKMMDRAIMPSYLVECDIHSLNKGILTFTKALSLDQGSSFLTIRHTPYFFNKADKSSKFHVLFFYHRDRGQSIESMEAEHLEELKKITADGRLIIHAKGPGNTMLRPYFSHFNAKGIVEGAPWELLRSAGDHRTLFIGSAASFESVNAIIDYNEQLMAPEGPIQKWLASPLPSKESDPISYLKP